MISLLEIFERKLINFVKSGNFRINSFVSTGLYQLDANGTIDKVLLNYKDCCSFGRYGVRFWILADAENHYCYNASFYLEKEGNTLATNFRSQVLQHLVEPIIHNSRWNITCDCDFTNVELFEDLLSKRLTTVGKVMPNQNIYPLISLLS